LQAAHILAAVQVQIALPHEVVAAAQAAAAGFHGQSQQFSVRFMAAADESETREQAEVPMSTGAAEEADPASGGMPAEPSSDPLSATPGNGLLPAAAHVTGLLDGARLAAGSSIVSQHREVPASALPSPQAQPDSSDAEPAPATPGDSGKSQPRLQQEPVAEGRDSQSTDDELAREQQNSLRRHDADAERSEQAPGHSHVEL